MGPADSGGSRVAAALQRYADRGVFRAFSSRAGRGGRRAFQFTWLARRPIVTEYDPPTRVLTFKRLLPRVAAYPDLSRELRRVVHDHQTAAVPAHRRIDPRRVQVGCRVRGGDLSLTLAVKGPHHAYAVQRGLNLVNEMFVLLQANYPGYLIECFDYSAE